MVNLELNLKTGNPCKEKKEFCKNCSHHYADIRPSIRGVFVSNHFIKDTGGEEKSESLIESILKCSKIQFKELHKFEKHVGKFLIFRAKIDGTHVVYSIDKKKKDMIFLRLFKNYSRYKKYLEDDSMITKSINRAIS